MRNLLLACTISAMSWASIPAWADDANGGAADEDAASIALTEETTDDAPEATATAEAPAPVEPPAPIDPLAHIEGRPDAPTLSTDDLWTEFEVAFANFERDLAMTEDAPPTSQTGFRNYVQAIDSAAQVRDLLRALLDSGDLADEDRLDATDSVLTIDQVAGSLMVEIEQCEAGAENLRVLLQRPETQERPLLLQGATQWLGKAERCVERQRLQAQLAERESLASEDELQRLRQEIADAESATAQIEAREASGQDDELVLSRAELLSILRESAGERRADGIYSDLFTHPRAHLPSHEFGFAFRGGITHVPNFMLSALYERHGTAVAEPLYGGSFFVRKNERLREISLNYDHTYLDLGAEWWVRRNKTRGSSRWTEIHGTKHTVSVGLDRNFPLGKRERFQFHIGGLFGFSILPNLVDDRTRVDAGACLIGVSGDTAGHLERFEPGGACVGALDPTRTDRVGIPKFLPSLGLRGGMRYVIADRVQIGAEAGVQDFYFFANATIGIIVARRFANR